MLTQWFGNPGKALYPGRGGRVTDFKQKGGADR
jgi:hypothetical protein